MEIELHVTNRRISRVDNSGNIPSGGINDVKCKFTFDLGSDWVTTIPHITAIFARETKWAFQIEITPNAAFYIPASILARQGVVYASLLGTSSDGVKVAQTSTCALVVEPNGLNRNTNIIYPLDQHHEYDSDAYAQYVAAVNSAAERSEEALRKLESYLPLDTTKCGYTKTEADARFQQKTIISRAIIGGEADISDAVKGSIPAIKVIGVAPTHSASESYENPGPFAGVNAFNVSYDSGESLTLQGFGTLYNLATGGYDYLDVGPDTGMTLHRKINVLDLKVMQTAGKCTWNAAGTILSVNITGENEIDTNYSTATTCNIGNCIVGVYSDHIDIGVPLNTDLTDIKVAYVMKNEYTTVTPSIKLPAVGQTTSKMTIKHIIGAGTGVLVGGFWVNMEVNLFSYFAKELAALEARVKALEEADA